MSERCNTLASKLRRISVLRARSPYADRRPGLTAGERLSVTSPKSGLRQSRVLRLHCRRIRGSFGCRRQGGTSVNLDQVFLASSTPTLALRAHGHSRLHPKSSLDGKWPNISPLATIRNQPVQPLQPPVFYSKRCQTFHRPLQILCIGSLFPNSGGNDLSLGGHWQVSAVLVVRPVHDECGCHSPTAVHKFDAYLPFEVCR